MKKIILNLLLIFTFLFNNHLFAQVPQGVNYQAVLADNSGLPLANTNVGIKFIIQSNGSDIYEEEHFPSTNDIGKVSLIIGQGNVLTGNFNTINWATNTYDISVYLDNGSGYVLFGTSPLSSVFYALQAQNALVADSITGVDLSNLSGGSSDNQNLTNASLNGTTLTIDIENGSSVSVDLSSLQNGGGSDNQTLSWDDSTNTLSIDGGNAIILPISGGSVGPQGETGPAGPQGASGTDGVDGIQGPIGPQGDAASDDQTLSWDSTNFTLSIDGGNSVILPISGGSVGPQGPQGADGQNGNDGSNGINCWDTNGNSVNDANEDINNDGFFNALDCQGPTGADGQDGVDGTNGVDGIDGAQGPQGDPATDDQILSISNDTIYLENGGFVKLPAGTVDADADPTNELQNLSFSTNFDSLLISGGEGIPINTSAPNFEDLNNIPIGLEDGDDDNQILSISNDTIYLEDGGFAVLPAGTSGSSDEVLDADGDTKIQVEESADEDIIRFDLAGIERFRMIDGRIEVFGSGGSVFVGSRAGEISGGIFGDNVGLGRSAMQNNTDGYWNVALGSYTMLDNTTGASNTALGTWTLRENETGSENTAVGNSSIYNNTTGLFNTGVGSNALYGNTVGSYNVALGKSALFNAETADSNVAVGFNAGNQITGTRNTILGTGAGYSTTGSGNILLGAEAGRDETGSNKLYIQNSATPFPLIYGEFDVDGAVDGDFFDDNLVQINGFLQIGDDLFDGYQFPAEDGNSNQILQTDGNGSLNWADLSSNDNDELVDADGDTKIQVEESADEDIIRFDLEGTEYFRMNKGRLEFINDGNSIFIGLGAGINQDNTSDRQNVGIGTGALATNSTGSKNVAVGDGALKFNSTGTENVALGMLSMFINSTGSRNTASGFWSLTANSTGSNNVANGYFALASNTTGGNNVANGYETLKENLNGYGNAANGYRALTYNISGSYNVTNGYNVLFQNTTGSYNVGNGYNVLFSNNGDYNVANGYNSMGANTTGSYNVANGYEALRFNRTGNYNVAEGYEALRNNTVGINNIALGYQALRNNVSGNDNIALGYKSMENNGNSNNGVAIGHYSEITGENNVAIGAFAGCYANGNNSIAISQNVSGSNTVRIGANSVTSIGGYASWSNLSDGRFKTNVKENVTGLEFIMQLRPVTYNLNMEALAKFNNTNPAARNAESDAKKAEQTQTGFIAQEVEAAAKALGYEFSGVDAPQNAESHYGLRYAEFVVPLVKAMQEQQAIIDSQEELNAEQQAIIQQQQTDIETLKSLVQQLLNQN